MAFPKQSEIQLPILIEVEAAGGEVRPNAALFQEIAKYFSQIRDEDLKVVNRTGINTWENKVHWARLGLVHKGEIDKSKYGVWRITEKGQERVAREVGTIPQIQKVEESLHSRIERQIEDIGKILGKYARTELKEGPYSYDVIWKDADWLPRCTHVFEVQDKGNVLEALVRLKHAYDSWGSRLFLVVTGERDRDRVHKMLLPYVSGAFHEIGSITTVLSPEEIQELYDLMTRYKEVMAQFVAR